MLAFMKNLAGVKFDKAADLRGRSAGALGPEIGQRGGAAHDGAAPR